MSGHNSTLKEEAKGAVGQYNLKGKGCKSVVNHYNETAENYDDYMAVLNFNGPSQIAKAASEILKNNYNARILDVGAGTGLAGVELTKLGYTDIDAVDPSEGLLKVAKSKNVYKKIFQRYVGDQKLPIDDNTYNMAVICGAIGDNHIPKTGLVDIIRVVKPGGFIVNVFREESLRAQWYVDDLGPYMDQLEQSGKWKKFSRKTFPKLLQDLEGVVLIHKVL